MSMKARMSAKNKVMVVLLRIRAGGTQYRRLMPER